MFGGSTPSTSFDCSGLTQWCYAKAGSTIPRVAQAQYDAMTHISLKEAKTGDDENFQLSEDMMRSDIPTSAKVPSVKIQNVIKESNQYRVSFEILQRVSEGAK